MKGRGKNKNNDENTREERMSQLWMRKKRNAECLRKKRKTGMSENKGKDRWAWEDKEGQK